MSQFLAILGDGLRESLDRKWLYVLLFVSLIPIAFCASLSFEIQPMDAAITEQIEQLGQFRQQHRRRTEEVKVESTVDAVPTDDGWDAAVLGGNRVELRFETEGSLDQLAVAWFEFTDKLEEVPLEIDGKPRAERFLEERFLEFGFDHVQARVEDKQRALVAVRAEQPALLQGAHQCSMLFGAISFPLSGMSVGELVTTIQSGLASALVGFFGILIAILVTSSFVPNMLQKGTLDLVLARPISRTKLLIGKYLCGVWFVLIPATMTITGCWLALALATGYDSPAFLAAIPLMLLVYATLHAVSVFVAILTRSGIVGALAAIGVWFITSQVVGGVRTMLRMPDFIDAPDWLLTGVNAIWWVLPKISEIDIITKETIATGVGTSQSVAREFAQLNVAADPWITFTTTIAFAVLFLGLACWRFRKRDW